MNILVAYNSRGGRTRQAADAIAAAVRKPGRDVVLKPVAEVGPDDVQGADVVFVGTWVQGLIFWNVRPAGADQWLPALPPLTGKPVAVFCTSAFNPRCVLKALGSMLKARGATIKGERAFHRRHPGAGAEQFAQGVLEVAGVVAQPVA
jgi:flavodoxin